MSRIVITTWGSLGDLHPYVAIALELQRRGHAPVLATSPCYREKVDSLGLEFQSVRPDSDWLLDGDKVRRFSHPRWGLLRVGRELLMPAVAEAYEDTLASLCPLPSGVIAAEYIPFAALFPRAAAIIHHGGVGTTGQAMRSGRPMLVVPYAWDQPDNAQRVARMGIGRTLHKHHYTPERAAAEVKHLLDNPAYSERASRVGEQVRNEGGAQAACDALENVLRKKRSQ